jgi:hypothetical protein
LAYTPNLAPTYPTGPTARMATVPATAKTVFTDASNTAVLVDRATDTLNNRMTFGSVFVQPNANIVAGKFQLYLYDGTTYRLLKEVVNTAQAGITATAAGTPIDFGYLPTAPLVVPDGYSLLVATAVAQTASSVVAHAQLGKVF